MLHATRCVQVGGLLTCASLGSNRALLFTGPGPGERIELSADHRVCANTAEQERLLAAGARLTAGGAPGAAKAGAGPVYGPRQGAAHGVKGRLR